VTLRWTRGVLTAAAAVASLVACPDRTEKRQPRKLTIGPIEILDRTADKHKLDGVTPAVVARWIQRRLRRSPYVEVAHHGDEVYELTVELGVSERQPAAGGAAKPVFLVAARARVPAKLEGNVLQASALRTLDSRPDAAALRRRLRRTVEGVADDLVFQAKLSVGPPQLVIAALRRKDVPRLIAAVEIAGVRKLRGAVPRLVSLLGHSDARVADRCIGALVAIGDRRAVRPLARAAAFDDTERLAKVIDAIAALGGKEAVRFLEFVATGHPDADLRNMAREALARMGRKRGK